MQLATNRLILREFAESDWQALLAYQKDPLYLRYNTFANRTENDGRTFVGRFIEWQQAVPRIKFQLVATLRDSGQIIGNCGIRKTTNDATEAEIGYEFDSRYWGKGYATEAAQALLDYGFTELKLHRIHANCIADNVRSAQVMARIGMQCEGRLRDVQWFKGRWWDKLIYAILENDYRTTL